MDAISNSGDTLLILLLFWGMFLPIGAKWSVDSLLNGTVLKKKIFSAATIALYIQFALLYITTGIFKGNYLSWHDGSHLYLTFSRFEYMNPIAFLIYPHYELLSFLTHFTLFLELFGPLLFFIPFFFLPVRMVGILLFAGLQISIAITMKVGFFPISSLAGVLVFIPAQFWDLKLLQKTKNKLTYSIKLFLNRFKIEKNEPAERSTYTPNSFVNLFAAFMLVYVLFWNLNEISSVFSLPEPLKKPGYYLKVDQRWAMFSSPPQYSRMYSVHAHFEDGIVKDVMEDLKNEYSNKKGYRHVTFKNDRWRKLFSDQIRYSWYPEYRESLLSYFYNRESLRGKSLMKIELFETRFRIGKSYDLSEIDDRVLLTKEALKE